MSDKRAPRRSLDDWMELVTECRQSGLTDAAWCEAQGISPSCFYNAISRLRKRACQIPDPIGKASTLDLTSHKQDVVQIAIEPELSPAELFQDERSSSMYLDNSHTIEIEAKGLTIRMSNTVQPMLLKILMDAYLRCLCQLHYLQDAEAHLLTARAQTTARKQKKKQIQQKHYLQQITTSSQIITLTHSTQTP